VTVAAGAVCSGECLAGEREGATRVAPGDTREEPMMVGRHRARAGEGVWRRWQPWRPRRMAGAHA
jgi:hypothetical protein